jgi:NTE family protein
MIDPVPYQKVRGVGFYRQFLDNSEWAAFMRAGRELALAALHDAAGTDGAAGNLAGNPAGMGAAR